MGLQLSNLGSQEFFLQPNTFLCPYGGKNNSSVLIASTITLLTVTNTSLWRLVIRDFIMYPTKRHCTTIITRKNRWKTMVTVVKENRYRWSLLCSTLKTWSRVYKKNRDSCQNVLNISWRNRNINLFYFRKRNY